MTMGYVFACDFEIVPVCIFWQIEPESVAIKGTNLYKIEHNTKFLSRSILEA